MSLSTLSTLRLTRDLAKLNEDKLDGVEINNIKDLSKWGAKILGPPNTPFENGSFEIEMKFTDQYPVKPPSVKFITPMFHPNIYKDGKVCVDILQSEWSPVQNVRTILVSLRSLLMDPNPNSPANREAAKLYRENFSKYSETIKTMINHKV